MNANENYPTGKDSQNKHRNTLGFVKAPSCSIDLGDDFYYKVKSAARIPSS